MSRRLRKSEILRGYRAFSRIISGGRSVVVPPLRAFFTVRHAASVTVLAGFAVARSIRSAASRNRAKRLMREAYRLEREDLLRHLDGCRAEVCVVLMYSGPSGVPVRKERFQHISQSVKEITGRIVAAVRKQER